MIEILATVRMKIWQEKVSAKRQSNLGKIPQEWLLPTSFLQIINASENEPTDLIALHAIEKSGLLSQAEIDITENYTASQLLGKIASGSVSAVAVTRAFSKRAAIAQQLVFISN